MSAHESHQQTSLGFDDPQWQEPVESPQRNPKGGKIVEAARPSLELAALGERLPDSIALGTSTWSFSGWHGLVYAEEYPSNVLARSGIGAYAQHPLLNAMVCRYSCLWN